VQRVNKLLHIKLKRPGNDNVKEHHKETYETNLPKVPIKEPYKRDLLNSPTKEIHKIDL